MYLSAQVHSVRVDVHKYMHGEGGREEKVRARAREASLTHCGSVGIKVVVLPF